MTPKQKRLKAKYAVFASQHLKAYDHYCQEMGVVRTFDDYELLKGFYSKKFKAKAVNKELVAETKAAKRIKRAMTSNVHRTKVEYNKRQFDCIEGSFSNVKEFYDKT